MNEEDIKVLEERIQCINEHIKGYEEMGLKTPVYHRIVKEKQGIENVLKELKRLKIDFEQIDHENDRLERIDIQKDLKIQKLKAKLEDSIPKQRIRDKMDEYYKLNSEDTEHTDCVPNTNMPKYDIRNYAIDILRELLY